MRITLLAVLVSLAVVPTASAQLTAAKTAPVSMGHHHLNVSDIAASRNFWVEGLGATAVKFETLEGVKLPNLIILFRQQAPVAGTKGSIVNHFGVQVPNIRMTVDKLKAAGYRIVSQEELPGRDVKDDLAWSADQNTYTAMVMGPDDTKIELVENKSVTTPLANDHIHFATDKVAEMKAWYVKTFGAKGGKRGEFEAADLPGVNLFWTQTPMPQVGTRGRALDHIGFEIKNLEEFCKKLESEGIKFDRPYSKIPIGLAIAFFTDPWGTYIELTEGLDKL